MNERAKAWSGHRRRKRKVWCVADKRRSVLPYGIRIDWIQRHDSAARIICQYDIKQAHLSVNNSRVQTCMHCDGSRCRCAIHSPDDMDLDTTKLNNEVGHESFVALRGT